MKPIAMEFIYFVAINHAIFSLDVLNINIIILAMSQPVLYCLGAYDGCV